MILIHLTTAAIAVLSAVSCYKNRQIGTSGAVAGCAFFNVMLAVADIVAG